MTDQSAKCLFETPSLGRTIQCLGLAVVSARDREPPDVVIGWSERDTLLLKPEFAILSDRGAAYLRLPVRLGELCRVLADTRGVGLARRSDQTIQLCTPLGQWKWGLGSVTESSRLTGPSVLTQLLELCRFGSKHWPGWYEIPLRAMRDRSERGLIEVDMIETMKALADSVAVMHVVRPLTRWASGGPEAGRIRALQETASYVAQRLVSPATLTELLAADPWWSELRVEVSSAEHALMKLEEEGVTVPTDVWDSLRTAGATTSGAILETVVSNSVDSWLASLPDWLSSSSRLTQSLDAIAASCANIARRLNELA